MVDGATCQSQGNCWGALVFGGGMAEPAFYPNFGKKTEWSV
jgi:hypothetical protein